MVAWVATDSRRYGGEGDARGQARAAECWWPLFSAQLEAGDGSLGDVPAQIVGDIHVVNAAAAPVLAAGCPGGQAAATAATKKTVQAVSPPEQVNAVASVYAVWA